MDQPPTFNFGRFEVVFLVILCAVTLILRLLMLAEYVAKNPIASAPVLDGAVYWKLAGDYASGKLIGDTPFLSGPLYPYLLGVTRFFGGGLQSVYVTQILLHIVTAMGVAWLGWVRFGRWTGVLAATLFVLMNEPAVTCFRILAGTVQLFLVTVCWIALLRVARRATVWRWGVAGLLMGLLCLANPPAILLVLPFAVWAISMGPSRRECFRNAGGWVVGCLLALSPATIHNALACGEFIPLTAHSGLTLRHGNGPGAKGLYTPVPGISLDRARQNQDALEIYSRSTGKPANWAGADRFFRKQVLEFWWRNPGATVGLALRKLYWFLTGRHAGDIHFPTLEQATGVMGRWALAPISTAWLIPASMIAMAGVLMRRFREWIPELGLFVAPLFVVATFWYSPRYRLPVVPLVAVFAAQLWVGAWVFRRHRRSVAVGLAGLLLPLSLGLLNRSTGFDAIEDTRAAFHEKLASAYDMLGGELDALHHYEMVLKYAPRHELANCFVGHHLHAAGKLDEAASYYQRAAEFHSQSSLARTALGAIYGEQGRYGESLRVLQESLEIDPDDKSAQYNIAGTWVALNQPERAIPHYEHAIRLDPRSIKARYHLGRCFELTGNLDRAIEVWREALRINADFVPILIRLAEASSRLQNAGESVERSLAWARRAVELTHDRDADALKALTIALRAAGRTADAVRALESAIQIAEENGADSKVQQLRAWMADIRADDSPE